MSLKSRLKKLEDRVPARETTSPDPIIKWLIENKHSEFIYCFKKAYHIRFKGDNITEKEGDEYEGLMKRLSEIREAHSHKKGWNKYYLIARIIELHFLKIIIIKTTFTVVLC